MMKNCYRTVMYGKGKSFVCLVLAVLLCCLSSCRCLVSCGLGDRLDQAGRAEAKKSAYVEKKPFYQLNDCFYARVRLEYYSEHPSVLKIAYVSEPYAPDTPAGASIEGFLLMSASEVDHHLEQTVPEPPATARKFIPADEFDFKSAVHLSHSPCINGCGVRGIRSAMKGGLHPLTLTYHAEDVYPGVPVRRSAGNYIRTPLVALLSYGVDVPVSLAGSTIYIIVAVPALIGYYYF